MNYIQSRWRLLITPARPGAWNMAVDEALLNSVYQGLSPPILRLYSWEPACLSLGYAQPMSDVDLSLLSEHGWQVVRRPTGGRAILHTDELTYSVITPNDEPRLAGSILQSYHRIAHALLQALWILGIPAQSNESSESVTHSKTAGPVCFEVPSNYEITVGGKKLIGSAQARKREGILQHGSLPLHGDLARITQVLFYEDQQERKSAAARLLERATTVADVLGHHITWESASQAFRQAFSQTLNLELQPQELSSIETTLVANLVDDKYNHPAWTNRV